MSGNFLLVPSHSRASSLTAVLLPQIQGQGCQTGQTHAHILSLESFSGYFSGILLKPRANSKYLEMQEVKEAQNYS